MNAATKAMITKRLQRAAAEISIARKMLGKDAPLEVHKKLVDSGVGIADTITNINGGPAVSTLGELLG